MNSTTGQSPNPTPNSIPNLAPTLPTNDRSQDGNVSRGNTSPESQSEHPSEYPSENRAEQSLITGSYLLQPTRYGVQVQLVPFNQRPTLHTRPTPPPPLQPPLPLLGRGAELEQAIAAFHSNLTLEVCGDPGMGKTTLIHNLIDRDGIAQQFPDGIIYLPLVHHTPVEDLRQRIFAAFYDYDGPVSVKPTPQEIPNIFQRQALVVLDDVALSRDGLMPLLQGLPGLTFLLATTERHLWTEGETLLLEGLANEDVRTLIEHRSPLPTDSHNPDPTLADLITETECLDSLIQHLQGNPQHILQAIAHAKESGISLFTLSRVLDAIENFPQWLATESKNRPKIQQKILGVLGLFGPIPLSLQHLTALVAPTATDFASLESPLNSLLQARLIESIDTHSGPNYRLCPAFIEPLQNQWDLSVWETQVLTYFTTWSQHQAPGSASLVAAQDILWRLVEIATTRERWGQVCQLCSILDPVFLMEKRWERWRQLWEVGLRASRHLGDRLLEALALHQLGSRSLCLQDTAAAYTCLTNALRLRQRLGDEPGTALTQQNLRLLPTLASELLPPPPLGERVRGEWASWLPWALLLTTGAIATTVSVITLWPRDFNLRLSPQRLQFVSQPIQVPSKPRPIVLTNTGRKNLSIEAVAITGAQRQDFQLDAAPCTRSPLPPQGTCNLTVTFTPQAAGSRTAKLEILAANRSLSRTLELTGSGEVGTVISVPDVRRLSSDKATALLRQVGLTVKTQTGQSTTLSPGLVMAQDPAPNQQVPPGTPVTLTIVGQSTPQGKGALLTPGVIGLNREQARQQLEKFGLKVVEKKQPSLDVPSGLVIDQTPAAGERTQLGSTVTLTIAEQASPVEVPQVTGLPLANARAQLSKAGFTVVASLQPSGEAKPGQVIAQDPIGGAKVLKGTTITLTVAQASQQVVVPTVKGLTLMQAKEKLSQGGFQVVEKLQAQPGTPAGQVINQSPDPGATVKRGTTVTLTVADGPSLPDLIVQLDAPTTVSVGEEIGLALQVAAQNAGQAIALGSANTENPVQGYWIDLVLSSDEQIPSRLADYSPTFVEDGLLSGGRISDTQNLASGASQVYRIESLRIPLDIPSGDYFLCAQIDPANWLVEANEVNNVQCNPIRVTPPSGSQPSVPDLPPTP